MSSFAETLRELSLEHNSLLRYFKKSIPADGDQFKALMVKAAKTGLREFPVKIEAEFEKLPESERTTMIGNIHFVAEYVHQLCGDDSLLVEYRKDGQGRSSVVISW